MNEELAKLSAAMLKKVKGIEAKVDMLTQGVNDLAKLQREMQDEQKLLREGIKTLAQCQKNYGDHRGHPDE